MKIQFGEMNFEIDTSAPHHTVENNKPAEFGTEVEYNNIKAKVNVTRANERERWSEPIKGPVLEHVPVQVVASGEAETLQAIKKRCDYRTQPDVGRAFERGHALLMTKIHERETIRLDREKIEAYLAEMSPKKRERLSCVLDDGKFESEGMHDKTVFAKAEALVKNPGAQPRVVYQGTDTYNLILGAEMYYLSRRMAEELSLTNPANTGNRVVYAVGLPADEIADIVHHTPGECVENDFKNNDGTQPGGVRKKEAMFYYKLGASKWFVREFARNTSVRVFTRYGVSGTVTGQRWSGEVTTTSGNGYVNACISLAALEKAEIERSTTLVYGDDQLVLTDSNKRPELAAALKDVSKDTGMESKPVVVEKRAQATFLRKRFARSADHTYPVPSFGRVLAKLPIRSNFNESVKDDSYMAGKLLSAAYEHRHVESIRRILLRTADELCAEPHLDMRNQAMAHKFTAAQLREMTGDAKVVDVDYLHSFLRDVYGISEDELVSAYTEVCEGILGFQVVNGNRGKKQTKLIAPKLPRALWNTTYESLVTVDVAL